MSDIPIEEAAAVVQETIYKLDRSLAAAFTALGVAAGGAVGAFLGFKLAGKKFDERLEREMADYRAFLEGTLKKESPKERLMRVEAEEALLTYKGEFEEYDSVDDEPAEIAPPKVVTVEDVEADKPFNIFTDDPFDMEEEVKYRNDTEPYVITVDEFNQNEGDFEQVSLTYYEEDDTLTGEDDEVYNDLEGTVGEDNLIRFGHGSKDKNTVYIRNPRLEIDYEVVKTDLSFVDSVLGMSVESDVPGNGNNHNTS